MLLVTSPIPQEISVDSAIVDSIIDQAVAECEAKEVRGKARFIYLNSKLLEPICCKKRQKSSNQETGFGNV